MRKRSLFVRIFGWFWLCVTLVAAGNILVLILDQPHAFMSEHRQRSARMVRLLAEGQMLTDASARAWIERVKEDLRMEIHLFDGQGRPLAATTAAPEARQALALAMAGQEMAHVEIDGGYWLAVPLDAAGGGKTFAVGMVNVRRPPPYAFLGPGPVGWRLAFLFALSGVVCLLLARSLSAPLRTLRDAAQRLAEGDLEARVPAAPLERGDEIADLARDFNLMAERLGQAMTAQKRLLTDISHELRSPLARMNVALELARSRTGDEAVRALDRIGTETERMNELIGQILSLSRLELGEARRNLVETDLVALAERVAHDADFEAAPLGKRVTFTGAGPVRVSGNEELLARAVENVVRNAVRHAPAGTAVEVSIVAAGEGRVSVIVRDHGTGVPPEALERIFEPFYRVADARERATGGTGLGLAISKQAILVHGGEIAARNHPGGGFEVTVTIPRSR